MHDLTTDMLYAQVHNPATKGPFGSANSLYDRARARGRRHQLWSRLCGKSLHLYNLAEVDALRPAQDRRYGGLQSVPIRQIRGSESRSNDFDRDFCPLQDHNKGRWLRIAAARQRGEVLPPVSLIQVGDLYFVRDGHHRISVARAEGQLDIEAEVVVWQEDRAA
ncbi:MAG: hypothetical protein PVF47_11000 [Anaerolineae bacterium]|jgi:hypothetical protein